ncbi:hypothetical protein CCAX7_002590 [Capsulimonas corticalis]|uniref:Uncharacterized protein n=1 Tax=Capsulimonas corticalis TaxID=2219043 RepID=A0A402CS29_9BACT|nr:prepilin-type N-terminal cleavage/methylation domain-containing protein [Capsulimonas corticalis]BDI28208.1 hypothetical protein CCAX7_002590 [Capsulimonas corticalis]
MKPQAFTRTELLIALAVVALLGAILFPVIQIRKNGQLLASCESRERQISSALSQYVQDNDQTYPWSYNMAEGAQNWHVLILPYAKGSTKPGADFTCPSANTSAFSYSANGQVICLLDQEHKTPSRGCYGSVVKTSRVANPRETVLLADALLGAAPDSTLQPPARRSAGEFAYPHPASVKDHTDDKGWEPDWFGIPYNNHQISWRHSGGANVLYCDGHSKYTKPGDLKDANWDVRCWYGQACEGSPNSPVYPAPDGTCGGQSPIDCQ